MSKLNDEGYVRITAAVIIAVLIGVVTYGIAAQDKEAGDKAHWGVAALRSNGDFDTDGAFTGDNGTITGSFSAGGAVSFTGLPTTTNGLVAGDLWDDSGTVKIMQ